MLTYQRRRPVNHAPPRSIVNWVVEQHSAWGKRLVFVWMREQLVSLCGISNYRVSHLYIGPVELHQERGVLDALLDQRGHVVHPSKHELTARYFHWVSLRSNVVLTGAARLYCAVAQLRAGLDHGGNT